MQRRAARVPAAQTVCDAGQGCKGALHVCPQRRQYVTRVLARNKPDADLAHSCVRDDGEARGPKSAQEHAQKHASLSKTWYSTTKSLVAAACVKTYAQIMLCRVVAAAPQGDGKTTANQRHGVKELSSWYAGCGIT